jgi:hypothetical protein
MKVFDRVMVSRDNDNEGYNEFRDKVLIITGVSYSTDDHPGYDDFMEGMGLFDLETEDGESIGSSLYEYELEHA